MVSESHLPPKGTGLFGETADFSTSAEKVQDEPGTSHHASKEELRLNYDMVRTCQKDIEASAPWAKLGSIRTIKQIMIVMDYNTLKKTILT